jgi:serine/threonine protein kinase
LVQQQICPNFVLIHGIFSADDAPPESLWGMNHPFPSEPKVFASGRFQYIRMELCTYGDAEGFLKKQHNEMLGLDSTRHLLFQLAYALCAAQAHYSLKHYDVKLLNVLIQEIPRVDKSRGAEIRYNLKTKTFLLDMLPECSVVAKLADFGRSNMDESTNGTPVTKRQFTTLENTPPDFLILGDDAKQGHSHDAFGLGLCMFHLFSGHAPYEEIMENVKCPSHFKEKLVLIWERCDDYSVIREVILADVKLDADGDIMEGERDETLYDTLYRYLVLFGIPEEKFGELEHPEIWDAVSSLESSSEFSSHKDKYSLMRGSNKFVKRAHARLTETPGAMELLQGLCSFDPEKRASTLHVLNSPMMYPLIEGNT